MGDRKTMKMRFEIPQGRFVSSVKFILPSPEVGNSVSDKPFEGVFWQRICKERECGGK